MSLWLQEATELLNNRQYEEFRRDLLPNAPIVLPSCLLREVEFGERCCVEPSSDPLFPIRFLWLFEGNEQRLFGLPALGRSRFHPEVLLFEVWNRVCSDPLFRQKLESNGFLFNLSEKAVAMSTGWILIGGRFIEDLLEIETALGCELLFPDRETGKLRPAFQAFKRDH